MNKRNEIKERIINILKSQFPLEDIEINTTDKQRKWDDRTNPTKGLPFKIYMR